MRKLISLIALILCLTFSIGIAASAEFDLSSMTTEELQALTRLIAEEIAKRSAAVVEKEKEISKQKEKIALLNGQIETNEKTAQLKEQTLKENYEEKLYKF